MTARRVRLQQRAEEGDLGARTALELAGAPNRFLSTVQIGITLIGTLSGALGGAALSGEVQRLLVPLRLPENLSHYLALGLVVIVITYLSLVIGELVPKRLALSNPERIAGSVAAPMKFLSRLTGPVVSLLSLSTEFILRLLRVKKSNDPPITEEEVRVLLQEGEQVGIFEETETDMVELVFRLGDRRVDSLMTNRTEIEWLDLADPFADNLREVLESPHGFFPVAEDNLDNVLGVLRSKDLLARVVDGVYRDAPNPDLRDLVQPALFIPELMPAFSLMEQLREASGNLALVIDEYGGLQGMVTLFDVLEAIVGVIPEQGHPLELLAIQREDGSWLLDGTLNIEEFKDLLDIDNLPGESRSAFQTVAGFVLAQLGEIPQAGQRFTWENWTFEVLDMDGLRIDKVLASPEAVLQ